MEDIKPRKISDWIKDIQWELDTYGDGDVKVCWDKHEQLHENQVFFSRVIGNYEMVGKFTKEEIDKLEPTDNDGLWIQNFPY